MKDAELWKHVVRAGVCVESDGALKQSPKLTNAIIKSPIIIDGLPPSHIDDGVDWGRYTHLGLPFDDFWIESKWSAQVTGHTSDVLIGAQCTAIRRPNKDTMLSMQIIILTGDGPVLRMTGVVLLDHSLSVINNGKNPFGMMGFNTSDLSQEDCNDMLSSAMGGMCDVLLMLGTKNVSLEPRRQTDAGVIREATRRNGGHPAGYRYHVLVVRPPGARSDSPAQEIGNMPRHVCRGHLAEYGPEFGKGLLFGRLAGRFYIPPHLKGKKENGIVEKDYAIKAHNH